MVGTAPTFYKIIVTNDLLISLATPQYLKVTTVERLIPVPLTNRHIILQSFEALYNLCFLFLSINLSTDENVVRIETKPSNILVHRCTRSNTEIVRYMMFPARVCLSFERSEPSKRVPV